MNEFRKKVNKVLAELKDKNLDFRLHEYERDPFKQAKYYRRGRNIVEITNGIRDLQKRNCNFLANCILQVGPQTGKKKITWVYPGFSWHQWKEAADLYWFHKGKFVDKVDAKIDGIKGYELMAKIGQKNGLTAGYFWNQKDGPHLQYREKGVRKYYEDHQVDFEMEKKFGALSAKYTTDKFMWWKNLDSLDFDNHLCNH